MSPTLPSRPVAGVFQRLRGRSLRQVCFRGRQEAFKRLDLMAYRLGLQQVPRLRSANGEPAPRFFFAASELPRILEIQRESFATEVDRICEKAERLCAHEFDLLGFRGLSLGREIDWQLDIVHGRRSPLKPWYRVPFLDFETVGDHKVIWELNRHQHLVTLAKAFLLTRESRYLEELVTQWRHWVAHNPYPLGINWASALEVAFRSLAWIWVDHLLRDQPEVPSDFLEDIRPQLGRHGQYLTRYLSTYFAPNTHLLGEAVALFFLGTLYPGLPGARRWQTTGWRITREQAERQVRDDGLHFEQSIYYHVYALDFFMHAFLLAARNDIDIPRAYADTVEKMTEALATLSPGGIPPRMGDDDGGRLFDPSRNEGIHMLDPVPTGAAVFDRPDWKAVTAGTAEETLWLLGPTRFGQYERMPAERRPAASLALRESGLYVMAGDGTSEWRLVVDAGPQGTGRCGHGHADALSVQLASASGDWLVDLGTSTYARAAERDRFRGTAAHNTLAAGDLDQAVPMGPFAWKDIPRVDVERWVTSEPFDYLRAHHDGYARSPTTLTHQRTVVAMGELWLVRDEAIGDTDVELMVSWHLDPRLTAVSTDRRRVDLKDASNALTAMFAGPPGWVETIDTCEWSPAYGATRPSRVIRLRCQDRLPTEVATLILAGTRNGRLEFSCIDNAVVYEMFDGEQAYRFVFGRGPWRIGEFAGDDEFALFRGPSGERLKLVGSVPARALNG